jgi:hypothetical protein
VETKVAPVITDHWVKDQFSFDLLPAVKELGIERMTRTDRFRRSLEATRHISCALPTTSNLVAQPS